MNNSTCNDRPLRGAAAAHYQRMYASPGDFCGIFDEDMNNLYSLALVLTGSHETVEECFFAALDDCRTGSAVFPEWARSWSRRAVFKNAIRLLDPMPRNLTEALRGKADTIANDVDPAARAVLALAPLERFVFVITVLVGYATRECAALLGCSPREVQEAKVRAIRQIAGDTRDVLTPRYTDDAHIPVDVLAALY